MIKMRWFRKHQKVMLVFFGVILMLVFVVGSALPWLGGGRGGRRTQNADANKTVVKWNGGSLNRFQFTRLKNLHFATQRFYEQLMRQAQTNKNWGGPRIQLLPAINFKPQSEEFDRELFFRYLLAQYLREKMGMVISDDQVHEYLFLLSDLSLSDQDLFSINASANSQIDFREILEYMKIELASLRMYQLLSLSVPFIGLSNNRAISSGSAVDQFLSFIQKEKRFECAVLPFTVSDYLMQVKTEPGNAQIRELFDQGKYLTPGERPNEPGFKRPRKLAVEFLKGDFQAFLDRSMQDVTKEEVLAEYNRLVEAKDPLVMEDVPSEETPKLELPNDSENLQEPEKGSDQVPTPGEKKTEGAQPDNKQPDGKKPNVSANPTNNSPGSGNDAAPNPPDAEKSENKGPPKSADGDKNNGTENKDGADKSPGDDSPDKANQPGDNNKDGTSLWRILQTKYVSLSTQEPQETSDQPPHLQPPGKEKEAESSGDQPKPSTEKPSVTGPQEPVIPEAKKRPRKLDEVLELQIKERLKHDEAQDAMQKAIEKANEDMQDYRNLISDYDYSVEAGETPGEKPAPLDLKKLADKYHLTYGSTNLVDFTEFQDTELGKAMMFVNRRLVSFTEEIFMNFDSITVKTPNLAPAPTLDGSRYVYWVSEKHEARIPLLDEARNDVIEYWKKQEALRLATAAAQQAADELVKSGKSLLEKYPDTAKQTGEFAWFSSSPPLQVQEPGDEFMAEAFGLKADELGVAPNADKTVVYLIQKTKQDPRTDEELRDQFLKQLATFKTPVSSPVIRGYAIDARRDWSDFIADQMGVQWLAY